MAICSASAIVNLEALKAYNLPFYNEKGKEKIRETNNDLQELHKKLFYEIYNKLEKEEEGGEDK